MLHLDIMDGHFVPNITFGPGLVSAIRRLTPLFFDVHLMVDNPERFIEPFVESGADGLTVHVESTNHIHRCLSSIKAHGKKAGVAINPGTPVSFLECLIEEVDMVLVMTVNPGFGGQSLIPSTLKKIRQVKSLIESSRRNIGLQVDGGINDKTVSSVVSAGADILVSGVGVFRAANPHAAIEFLRHTDVG
jgi:ribulose-phosphate 3-epimerase